MSWLSALISVAESVIGSPTASELATDAIEAVEAFAPAPVAAGIAKLKDFLASDLGKEIEAAGADVFSHVVGGSGSSVLIEPITTNVPNKQLPNGGT